MTRAMDRCCASARIRRINSRAFPRHWLLASLLVASLVPGTAKAYNCGQRQFQSIIVSPSPNLVGMLATYTITAVVPALDGCDITTSSNINVIFPGATLADTIASGTMNGQPIAVWVTRSGPNLTFRSPVAVANNASFTLVLNGVTNDTTPGSKTLQMSAGPVQNGNIGLTTSSPYVLAVPTPTPSPTSSPTPTETPTPTLTATPTVTDTPTLTPTITLTPTRTATPTATATPGFCTFPLSTNPCVTGGGPRTTDCYLEWLPTPVPPRAQSGMPKNKLICYEGDPRCDADPVLTNGLCRVRLRLCINNQDPRLPQCAPFDLDAVEVKSPNPAQLRGDPADTANLNTLEFHLGAGGLGLNVFRPNAQVYFGAANSTPDACTNLFTLDVPLRVTSTGEFRKKAKKFRIKATSSLGRVDRDAFVFECRPSTCGDSVVQGDHETCDDGNRTDGDGCDRGCQLELPTPTPTATLALTATPTETSPPPPTATATSTATATVAGPTATATDTPTATEVPTVTSTPTITNTPGPQVCGNGVIEGDEECDDGGICTGGDNAGTACTSEADCVGNGVCVGGEKFSTACASDADCPGSRCVRCRPFGGDGCAANCTFERKVRGDFFFRAGSSAVVMVEGDIPLTVPLDGSQVLTYGKPGPDGVIPVVIKEAESVIRRTTLAGVCVCVRPVPAKTCGGTLFEADGVTRSLDCSFQDTCAANNKPPCSFLHGPGNSTSGFIGCQGLSPANMNWVQDAGGNPPPPPPTPIPGSGPPIVTFFGDGPPGSGIFVSTTRIGTASGGCTQPSPSPGVTPTPLWGPNREFCDDDDPEYARGVPNSIPLLTGQSSIVITNFYRTSTGRIETLPSTGPATITGAPFNCERLLAPTPSVIGAAIAGGFTALNQPQFGSLVTTNKFAYATATFTRTPTITPTGPTRTPTRSATATRSGTPTRTPTRTP